MLRRTTGTTTYTEIFLHPSTYCDVLRSTAPPAGPGPEIDDGFGSRPARGEMPQASANAGALERGTLRRPR
eukprot:4387478-Alexandrium_andersonii.AAC.1